MNKKAIAIVVAVVVLLGAVAFFARPAGNDGVGGDVAGGITPSQLFTLSGTKVTTKNPTYWQLGGVTQDVVAKTLRVGVDSSDSDISGIYTGSGTINLAALGPIGTATSTATSSVTLSIAGNVTIPVGTRCSVNLTTSPTSTPYMITGVVSTSSAASAASTSTVVTTQTNFHSVGVTVATGTAVAECRTY